MKRYWCALRGRWSVRMAKDSKLGTFGGVFTPSLLTILGVIMYLRLPMVIGNAGLYWGLGIILVAHVISVATGLSISSIATDKNVGAGGPYYIISRSLGLPIGGALGAALFIGLSFSVSLYIIGFSESLLDAFNLPGTKNAIRITGTVALLVITAVTFFSTAIAIKTQYFILALIAISLFAIFGGAAPTPSQPLLSPAPNSLSNAELFGIFFPAVTGFTAGVNMSGDLKNPRASIPRGTLFAIGAGLLVYVSLALFIGFRVDRDMLVNDPNVLKRISLWSPLVVLGISGATLSSALGSVLGAPRILQALAVDRIAPRWFARGYGKTNEPRNALLLAFLLGEAGILIAELDSIARVVSMVFLTMYGFLNMSCFIESWASPDFRPAFRIPKIISLVGAITSVVVMILLDLPAMLGATALMVAIFLVLKRKQLTLDSGDTWEGVWSSLLRSGLFRLAQATQQRRNWRPNILLFRETTGALPAIRRFGEALAADDGLLTDISLVAGKRAPHSRLRRGNSPRLGVIERELLSSNRMEDIVATARFHGFGQLTPNAVLLPDSWLIRDAGEFITLAARLAELDLNLLLFSEGDAQSPERTQTAGRSRIDVWWRTGFGNTQLALSLLRFITHAQRWEHASVRFLLLCPDVGQHDTLRSTLRRHLRDSRLEATIRILRAESDDEVASLVRDESASASLVLLGLPNSLESVESLERGLPPDLLHQLGPTLIYRANSSFEEVLATSRDAAVSFLPPAGPDGARASLPPLPLPATPQLAAIAREQAERYNTWLSALHVEGFRPLHSANITLIRRIREVFERQWAATAKAVASANPKKRRNLLNRAQSTILNEWREALQLHLDRTLPKQQDILEGRVAALLEHETLVEANTEPLRIERAKDDFLAQEGDSQWLRRFKRRRRFAARILRRQPRYRLNLTPLQAFHRHQALVKLVPNALAQWAADSHRLATKLGKLLHDPRSSPALFGRNIEDEDLAAALSAHGEVFIEQLTELEHRSKEHAQRAEWSVLVATRELAVSFADDVDRLDLAILLKRDRRLRRDSERRLLASLQEHAPRWGEHQKALIERAIVGLRVSSFQHRLGTIADREKQSLTVSLRSHTLSECQALLAQLDEAAADWSRATTVARRLRPYLDLGAEFDPKGSIDRLFRDSAELLVELPEKLITVTDETLERLDAGDPDVGDGEMTELPLRRLVQYVVEADFIAKLQETLSAVTPAEQRAVSVVHEVVRLVTYHLGELASADDSSRPLLEGQARPVLDQARGRVAKESETLEGHLNLIAQTVEQLHGQVVERTNTYELSRTASSLDQHLRLQQGRKAVFGARAWLRRLAAQIQVASVDLLYRRSAGQVLALRWQAGTSTGQPAADDVRQIVEAHTPKPEVYGSLPFYYRQLFLGQAAINDSFWVGRTELLQKAKRAIHSRRQGSTGAIMIVGERGSGKTALCHRIVSENGLKALNVHAPLGGSALPEDLEEALARATGGQGDPASLFAGLPKQSAIVVDDLELWWERTPAGLDALLRLMELIRTQSSGCLFILALSRPSFDLLNQLLPLSDHALCTLRCEALGARDLERIITLRHRSTGLSFELSGRAQNRSSAWALARLFTQHFDYSRGNVGAALRSWISHVSRFSAGVIHLRSPRLPDWERLDSLRPDWAALLLELLFHKQMSLPRLSRVTALAPHQLELLIDALSRSGLVLEPRPGIFEVNPFLLQGVVDGLRRKGQLR